MITLRFCYYRVRQFFADCQKIYIEKYFFFKNIPRKVCLDTKCSFDNCVQCFFWRFFEQKLGFLKKPDFLLNQSRWQLCYRMRIKGFYFLEMSLPPCLRLFLKIQKNFKLGKITKLDKETVLF